MRGGLGDSGTCIQEKRPVDSSNVVDVMHMCHAILTQDQCNLHHISLAPAAQLVPGIRFSGCPSCLSIPSIGGWAEAGGDKFSFDVPSRTL